MQQLQLVGFGEPSDAMKLSALSEPALGQEGVPIAMEAAPLDRSDFLLVRGMYGV